MNKLKTLFTIFAASLLPIWCLGCSYTIIDYYKREPFYINNSGVAVRLTAGEYELELKNNDTLCNYYLNDESCATANWLVPYDGDGRSFIHGAKGMIYFKIEFLIEPKVCLIYNGKTKAKNDIRYWENYTLIKEYSDMRMLSYTITPEHKAMAREEDCQ
ncbi:MAG: hypothetical protein LBH25_05120 [Fibromonadaceae bacterium]|jgi:hypothetical protein|nr:hypothetical protein [Fibromonadaceae bacterium]